MSEIDEEFVGALKKLSSTEKNILKSKELDEVREERGRKVDMQFIREIMYALQSVSIGTQQLLYFAGMKYSKHFLNSLADSYDECVEKIGEIFDELNIGDIEKKKDSENRILVLKENVISHNGPDVGKPICYFISGWIAGFLKGNLGKDFIVNEIECASAGAENCEFLVRER